MSEPVVPIVEGETQLSGNKRLWFDSGDSLNVRNDLLRCNLGLILVQLSCRHIAVCHTGCWHALISQ